MLLKWILKKWDWEAWSMLIGTGGRLFWLRQWTFRFHKMRRIFWLAEELVDSQEGLCSMEEVYFRAFRVAVLGREIPVLLWQMYRVIQKVPSSSSNGAEGFNGVLSVQKSVAVVLSSTDENRFDNDIVGSVLYFGPHFAEKTHIRRSLHLSLPTVLCLLGVQLIAKLRCAHHCQACSCSCKSTTVILTYHDRFE